MTSIEGRLARAEWEIRIWRYAIAALVMTVVAVAAGAQKEDKIKVQEITFVNPAGNEMGSIKTDDDSITLWLGVASPRISLSVDNQLHTAELDVAGKKALITASVKGEKGDQNFVGIINDKSSVRISEDAITLRSFETEQAVEITASPSPTITGAKGVAEGKKAEILWRVKK